jgi:hypothetical protein
MVLRVSSITYYIDPISLQYSIYTLASGPYDHTQNIVAVPVCAQPVRNREQIRRTRGTNTARDKNTVTWVPPSSAAREIILVPCGAAQGKRTSAKNIVILGEPILMVGAHVSNLLVRTTRVISTVLPNRSKNGVHERSCECCTQRDLQVSNLRRRPACFIESSLPGFERRNAYANGRQLLTINERHKVMPVMA